MTVKNNSRTAAFVAVFANICIIIICIPTLISEAKKALKLSVRADDRGS